MNAHGHGKVCFEANVPGIHFTSQKPEAMCDNSVDRVVTVRQNHMVSSHVMWKILYVVRNRKSNSKIDKFKQP